jgi:hypothetical protein
MKKLSNQRIAVLVDAENLGAVDSHRFPFFGFLRGRAQYGLLHFGHVSGSSTPRCNHECPHLSQVSWVTRTCLRIGRNFA